MVNESFIRKMKINQFSSNPGNLGMKSAFLEDFWANTDFKCSKCFLLDGKPFLKADFHKFLKLRCYDITITIWPCTFHCHSCFELGYFWN